MQYYQKILSYLVTDPVFIHRSYWQGLTLCIQICYHILKENKLQ